MSRRFLRADTRDALSNFPSTIDENDLITHFLLTPGDIDQVQRNRDNTQRLGFALLLCALRYLGFFPNEVDSAPENMVLYLAEQLNCHPNDLSGYGQRPPTRREHQLVLMNYLGFRRKHFLTGSANAPSKMTAHLLYFNKPASGSTNTRLFVRASPPWKNSF